MTDAIAMFDAPDSGAIAPLQSLNERTPYVVFYSAKSKASPQIIAKLGNVPEGTPIIMRPDGSMERLDAMKFWLTPTYVQYLATIDEKNAVLQATFGNKPGDNQYWVEHIDSVVLILSHRGIEPARLTFRGPKCNAARDVSAQQALAATEQWADEGNDNAVAFSNIKQVWLRVMGTVTLEAKKSKPKVAANGKPAQPSRDYIQANAHVVATSAGNFQAINSAVADEGFRTALQGCIDHHNERVAEVKSKEL